MLYVRGRPHVLRLHDEPLENVVTTGVSTAAVEGMENALKNDVLRELNTCGGRLLLHDEVEEDGKFVINAVVRLSVLCDLTASLMEQQWEDVKEDDIMTPREVFDLMKREGFAVDYYRLPGESGTRRADRCLTRHWQ